MNPVALAMAKNNSNVMIAAAKGLVFSQAKHSNKNRAKLTRIAGVNMGCSLLDGISGVPINRKAPLRGLN